MSCQPQLAGAALDRFRRESGLDRQSENAPTWRIKLGPLRLRLPNFAWRRNAIACHDLHHLLTGIPCTMRGEFQMATWEFAAGRLRRALATAFCLPLVAVGLLCMPRAILRAYVEGRCSRTLYSKASEEMLLTLPLTELQRMSRRADRPGPVSLALGFFALAMVAGASMVLPLAGLVAVAILL